MYAGFSSAIKLSDLNDFITPSQECIKPVEDKKTRVKNEKIQIEFGIDSAEQSAPQFEKAKITLNDCLACSGCITSAEVVLVSQQSLEQLCKILKENESCKSDEKRTIVLSTSSQAVLSLSAQYNLSPQETLEKVVGYFKSIGVDYVFDVGFARCFSILEEQKEFVGRFKDCDGNKTRLPLLAASCPGWVCYAEKAHGAYILPYLSTTRSPQQVMGSLVKDYWAKKKSFNPEKIYHATLMPCFDKKLEASREEFTLEELSCQEIDCVITPVELQQLFEKESIDFVAVEGSVLDTDLSLSSTLSTHVGSGSGGFAHHVFNYAAKHLFDVETETLHWKALRNNDMLELTLEVSGEIVLRFGIANGFRNIQNLVQKIKRGKSPYHYVEVMACPSGCLNGGAQIRPTEGKSSKELVALLESIYKDLPKVPLHTDRRVLELYSEWKGHDGSGDIFNNLHTTFRTIDKIINPLGIKW